MSLMPTAIPGPPESFRRGLCVSETQCISNLPPVPTRRALFKEGSHSFLSVFSHRVQAHNIFSVCVSFCLIQIDLCVEGLLADGHGDGTRLGDSPGQSIGHFA